MAVVFTFLDEMGHDVSLQMVYLDHGYVQRARKTLGEIDTDQQTAHQSRPACEGNGRKLFLCDACTFQSLVNHRYYILLVCP